ncbi:hypothetical protein EKK58_06920 [Candidatus Dependentiae bacterium]|nr:MAG: hypothetical protein EKK58_06920 [Candidatus Dependentiae bacterium]
MSHYRANVLNWHITNEQDNSPEQQKWFDGKDFMVTINNSKHTANGILLYDCCCKHLWDHVNQPSSTLLRGVHVQNKTYVFYHQPSVCIALLKVLKHDMQDGIIDYNSVNTYLNLIINKYKDILLKAVLIAFLTDQIDDFKSYVFIREVLKYTQENLPSENYTEPLNRIFKIYQKAELNSLSFVISCKTTYDSDRLRNRTN